MSDWSALCVAQVADIRIYTTNRDRVMPVIQGAKLLENTGCWQGILCEY